MLASSTWGFLPKRPFSQSIVGSSGRLYIQEITPRAKRFFDRSASRGFTPAGLTASLVSSVIGISMTR